MTLVPIDDVVELARQVKAGTVTREDARARLDELAVTSGIPARPAPAPTDEEVLQWLQSSPTT